MVAMQMSAAFLPVGERSGVFSPPYWFSAFACYGDFLDRIYRVKKLRAVTCFEIVSFGERNFAAGEDLARWLLY